MLLVCLNKLKQKDKAPLSRTSNFRPTVSLIITAYNEEKVIAEKLENSINLDYPKEKLEIIVVSDGSNDRTLEFARSYVHNGIKVIKLPQNVGKASAQNEAVKQATGDILVFTDAEAFLQTDAVRRLIWRFQNKSVACVVGRVIYLNEGETGVSKGEGYYWRYELLLRQKESELGILVMGSGSIMAVRRECFEPLDPAISEDFVLPMGAAIQGYKTVYEAGAVGMLRLFQVRPNDMFRTKVRTITLDTRSMFLCRAILNPFRYPLYALGLMSHKILRWLAPYFLIVLFVSNILLLDYFFYRLIFSLQIAFYSMAAAGYFWQKKNKAPRIFGIPFSFCLVNLAALVGVARFVLGKKSGQWKPVRNREY
jgi:glycosyltransferase involved in cell wall biosynthesis